MTRFLIRAGFDINCPWCYIGHTRLHRAIAAQGARHKADSFNIELVPYYLKPPPQLTNPKVPPFPVPTQSRKKLREETYGPMYANQVLKNIKEAAAEDHLPLKYDGPTGTTRNGHRLVYHAGQIGGEQCAEATLVALFKAYHEREEDIASLETLTRIGVEQGLGSDEDVRAYLLSGEDGERIDGLVEEAQRDHQGGVPFWVLNAGDANGSIKTGGALHPDDWDKIFDQLRGSAV